MRLRAGLLSVLVLSVPTYALAQDKPDPVALQRQLRAWFAGLLQPAITLPEPALRITRDGDGYRAVLPIDGLQGSGPVEITARLKALDGGRWLAEEIRLPSKGAFTIAGDDPDKGGGPTDFTFSLGQQNSRAEYDPGFAKPSSLLMDLQDVRATTAMGGNQHEQRFERYRIEGLMAPGGDGRLKISQEVTLSGWKSLSKTDDGTSVGISVGKVKAGGVLEGVNRERFDQSFSLLKSLLADIPGQRQDGKDQKALPPALMTRVRTLISGLRDLFTRFEGEESFDDIIVAVPGMGGASIKQVRFGVGGEAPNGRMHAWVDMALREPAITDLPPNLAKYMPSRIGLRPSVSGISMDRLFQLLLDATADKPDQKKLEAEALAMLTDGSASIGLESLSIELAPVKVEGSGRLRMLGPDNPGIEGRLSAVGFDQLMAEAQQDPELQLATPFLVLARGLARPDGERLVWDFAVTEKQALVNGVDVMKMGGQAGQDKQGQKKSDKR